MGGSSRWRWRELGLIDEYEFVVQPRLGGPRADVVRGAIEAYVDLRLVSRLEFGSGARGDAVEPRR